MELFNNENNDKLKFKINSEGIDINNIEPRLILTTNENKNYLFIGKVNNDICEFNIPELESYKKGDNGDIKFEIISEGLYFPVWNDKFDIITKASIQLEQVENIEEKPKRKEINIEAQPIIEKKEIKKKVNENIKTEKKKKIENQKPIKKNSQKLNDDHIKNFDKFFK